MIFKILHRLLLPWVTPYFLFIGFLSFWGGGGGRCMRIFMSWKYWNDGVKKGKQEIVNSFSLKKLGKVFSEINKYLYRNPSKK